MKNQIIVFVQSLFGKPQITNLLKSCHQCHIHPPSDKLTSANFTREQPESEIPFFGPCLSLVQIGYLQPIIKGAAIFAIASLIPITDIFHSSLGGINTTPTQSSTMASNSYQQSPVTPHIIVSLSLTGFPSSCWFSCFKNHLVLPLSVIPQHDESSDITSNSHTTYCHHCNGG